MLLVTDIIQVDENKAKALFYPKPNWPLAGPRGVASLLMIELAAQTAGLCSGWGRIQQRGLDSDPSGWLVGIKKANFFSNTLPYQQPIIISAIITFTYDNLREVSCQLTSNDEIIGQIILQLFKD